jgi:hypothetical protein
MSETINATWPLSLAEQLDSMLLGWLEHRADDPDSEAVDAATAVLTVTEPMRGEVEAVCARWNLSTIASQGTGRWTVLRVTGRPLPVMGLAEVIALLRRR